jgi:hypothetical protein
LSFYSGRHGEFFSSSLLQKPEKLSLSNTTLGIDVPQTHPRTPGPYSSQARRATMPFRSRIGTFCHPQDALLISLQYFQENWVPRYRETRGHVPRAIQIPETQWVSMLKLPCSCRGFPYREIDIGDVVFHCLPKSPNPDLRWHFRYGTSPSGCSSSCDLSTHVTVSFPLYQDFGVREFEMRRTHTPGIPDPRSLMPPVLCPRQRTGAHAPVVIRKS